jgi:hypothetical protein
VLNEVSIVVLLVVLVALPDELIVLLHDVSLDEAHLNEGIDRALDQAEINHFVVTISFDLVEDGMADTLTDLGEAVIMEKLEGCGGKTRQRGVLQQVPVLFNKLISMKSPR